MRRARFQVVRDPEGWRVASPLLSVEAQMETFPTKRAAIEELLSVWALERMLYESYQRGERR